MAKKTPSKKPTAITKRDKTLSKVKNAANTSEMKRLEDAVGGLVAIGGITPTAKRGLRRDLGFGSTTSRGSRRSRKVVVTYVGPPKKRYHFAPGGLRPQRPEPVEFGGRWACPCCTKLDGTPFKFFRPQKQRAFVHISGPFRGEPSSDYSKPYPEKAYNTHLALRHGFPSKRTNSMKESDKRKPGYGNGMGANSENPGGRIRVSPHEELWVWVYGKGWEIQEICLPPHMRP